MQRLEEDLIGTKGRWLENELFKVNCLRGFEFRG